MLVVVPSRPRNPVSCLTTTQWSNDGRPSPLRGMGADWTRRDNHMARTYGPDRCSQAMRGIRPCGRRYQRRRGPHERCRQRGGGLNRVSHDARRGSGQRASYLGMRRALQRVPKMMRDLMRDDSDLRRAEYPAPERGGDYACQHEVDRDDPGPHRPPRPASRTRRRSAAPGDHRAAGTLCFGDDTIYEARRYRLLRGKRQQSIERGIVQRRAISHSPTSRSVTEMPAACTAARKAVRARTSNDSNAFTFITIASAAAALASCS